MALVRANLKLKLSLPQPPSTPFPCSFPIQTTITSSASNPTDFNRIDVLGSGNGGTVYKVTHKTTSEIYSLKKVKDNMDSTSRLLLLREIEILRLVDSPYIVRCHNVFTKPSGETSILMEYMDLGALDSLPHGVTEDQLASIARQVLRGLSYLHDKLKIVHRDIKPANLLRNSRNEVKIADFGVSKIMSKCLDRRHSFVGTCAYMSPERANSEAQVSEEDRSNVFAGDIWSFGITMLEILVGYFPLLNRGEIPDMCSLMFAVCFKEPPKAPEECSAEFKSFIDCCLRKKPSHRWTASQLLYHPFLLHQK